RLSVWRGEQYVPTQSTPPVPVGGEPVQCAVDLGGTRRARGDQQGTVAVLHHLDGGEVDVLEEAQSRRLAFTRAHHVERATARESEREVHFVGRGVRGQENPRCIAVE